jgi:hypothetical protein
MRNPRCFSLATVVAGTRLNVSLYVHCLSCSCFLSYYDLCLPTHCRCRGILLHLITLSDRNTHTQGHNAHTRQTSTPMAEFEPANPGSALAQTYALRSRDHWCGRSKRRYVNRNSEMFSLDFQTYISPVWQYELIVEVYENKIWFDAALSSKTHMSLSVCVVQLTAYL